MSDITSEIQAAMDHFDEMVKLHGSIDKWITHRKNTDPNFVIIEEYYKYWEDIPYVSPSEATKQLDEARAKKLNKY